ncbi:MAG: hypothetical protein HYT97_01500 [Elusimicrobia bacterium]|nr:hypothetical protein [Elusimicrobiota bacterium]
MECPVCRKIQSNENNSECQFCGLIFEKWQAKQKQSSLLSSLIPPLLEISPSQKFKFHVDSQLRTLFGLLLFFVQPLVQWSYPIFLKYFFNMTYAPLSIICFISGIWIGMCADKRGYSGIFTAGGAGLLSGLLCFLSLMILESGVLLEKIKVATPVFGIYASLTFLGGIFSWGFKRYLHITL